VSASTEIHPTLGTATEHQPAARAALAAALGRGPSHAYMFTGPAGSGKRVAARAFAAELLALDAAEPDEARRRGLADPSPHPDLVWLQPPGNQHLVEDVRRRLIGAINYRPFEGGHSVYVIEAADALADESQNALLKTLEEPPSYAHLLLISSEPEALAETVRSRCQRIPFTALPTEVIATRLAAEGHGPRELVAALAALSNGDLDRARFLASERGLRLRGQTELCCRAARAGRLEERPWLQLLELATAAGEEQGEAVEAAAAERASELGKGRDADRIRREGADAAKRADRRTRTATIDTALALTAAWFTDLVAHCEGAGELARNSDRQAELAADAEALDPLAARSIAELAMSTRRRLQVNVKEELALEALFHRAAAALGQS